MKAEALNKIAEGCKSGLAHVVAAIALEQFAESIRVEHILRQQLDWYTDALYEIQDYVKASEAIDPEIADAILGIIHNARLQFEETLRGKSNDQA